MTRPGVRWRVVPLDGKAHDRSDFRCGAIELDRYIRDVATQDVKRDLARVFVANEPGGATVLGFYGLSAASFRRDDLPADQAKRLPRYPVPAALLGRLAVDDRAKEHGLGSHLLMDALSRVVRASDGLAVHAVVVDAMDDRAAAFYAKYGFIQFVDAEHRLFLPMATIRRLILG